MGVKVIPMTASVRFQGKPLWCSGIYTADAAAAWGVRQGVKVVYWSKKTSRAYCDKESKNG